MKLKTFTRAILILTGILAAGCAKNSEMWKGKYTGVENGCIVLRKTQTIETLNGDVEFPEGIRLWTDEAYMELLYEQFE